MPDLGTANVRDAIVIPIGAGALFLAAVTTWLGWWRPALFETRRAGAPWMLVVPGFALLAALIGIATFDWDSPRTDVLALLAVGVLLVGFSEELLTRGLLIVGLRPALKEPMVWFVTSLLFGPMHGLNIIIGQAVGTTLQQIVSAFVFGTVFYVTRRVTGTLIVCMLLHAVWDFASIGNDATGGTNLSGPLVGLAAILGLVAVWKLLRSPASTPATEPAPAQAPA